MHTVSRYWAAAICLTLGGFVSCTSGEPTGSNNPPNSPPPPAPPPSETYPENRGQFLPIFDINGNINIRWEDSAEIVYNTVSLTPRITDILALRLSNNSTRTIHRGGNVGGGSYHRVEVSPDGRLVYFSVRKAIVTDIDILQAAPGAEPVMIAAHAKSIGSTHKNAGAGAAILATPDSRGAAYAVGPDSMRMYDASTRTSRRIGEGCETPVAFSPDGLQLLCRPGIGPARIMSVATGSSDVLSLPAGAWSVFWDVQGIRVISFGTNNLVLHDLSTGANTTFLTPTALRPFELLTATVPIAWSRDGRRIAYSTSLNNPFGSAATEHVVHVFDIQSGTTQRAAVIKVGSRDPAIGQMAFSPDGRRLAYVIGSPTSGEVYVSNVQ